MRNQTEWRKPLKERGNQFSWLQGGDQMRDQICPQKNMGKGDPRGRYARFHWKNIFENTCFQNKVLQSFIL